jgi:cytochrome oxidase Cu insertion factor (SCO1/SenC/PrrC family)
LNPTENRQRRARLGLIGLAALFFVPLALSFYLYYGTSWRPLPEVALTLADGTQAGPEFLRGEWHLIYLGGGDCVADCRAALVKMRQVRLALDKDMDRVGRVFLYAGELTAVDYLVHEHPGLAAAGVDGEAGARLLEAFPDPGAAVTSGKLYVVDPLGNLMMSYPGDAPPKSILTDLERLLKLSHIG